MVYLPRSTQNTLESGGGMGCGVGTSHSNAVLSGVVSGLAVVVLAGVVGAVVVVVVGVVVGGGGVVVVVGGAKTHTSKPWYWELGFVFTVAEKNANNNTQI